MLSENSSFIEEKEQKSFNNEFFEENEKNSIGNKIEENQNNKSLIKVEINLGGDNVKELNINSLNNLDESINEFCTENKISKEANSTIKKILLDELNKKIELCKYYII